MAPIVLISGMNDSASKCAEHFFECMEAFSVRTRKVTLVVSLKGILTE